MASRPKRPQSYTARAQANAKMADLPAGGRFFGEDPNKGKSAGASAKSGPAKSGPTKSGAPMSGSTKAAPTSLPKELAWYGRKALGLSPAPDEVEDLSDAIEGAGARRRKSSALGVGVAVMALLVCVGLAVAFVIFHGAASDDGASGKLASDAPLQFGAGSQTADADADGAPNARVAGDTPFLESQKASAQSALKEALSEPHGLKYQDVQTMVAGEGDTQQVSFCGQVNAKDPSGAYLGFQRFISSPDHVQLENMMAPGEFSDAWTASCSGPAGPRIWS